MLFYQFIGLVLVVVLATIQGRVGRIGSFGMIMLALPATVLHELSHYLVALITGGRPTSFSIIPRSQSIEISGGTRKVWTLGSVGFYPNMVSAVPTALAPLLYLPAAGYLYVHWFDWFQFSGAEFFWLYVVIYLLLSASTPSWPDLKIVLTHPGSLAGYMGISALVYWAREPIAMTLTMIREAFPLF